MSPKVLHLFFWLTTFPYHWTLLHFTVLPIQRLVCEYNNGGAGESEALVRYWKGKLEELNFVKVGVCPCQPA